MRSMHLDAARRADAAGRALAARLDGAELHRVARHARHVDRVVEDDDAAVAEQRADAGERLVVERRVELRLGQVGAERSADLHGANRPARRAAAAVVVEQLRSVRPKAFSIEPAALDVAGELHRQRAARLADAEVAVERRALARMIGTVASEMTLLTIVGLPKSPLIAGSGGRTRTSPRFPSRLSSIDVSSPQM